MLSEAMNHMKTKVFALLLLMMLFGGGMAHASQVLVNGTLETGSISPWTTDTRYGQGAWTITSSGCFAGNFCATDTGNAALEQIFASVSTSTISSVTFEEKADNTVTAYDLFYAGGIDDEFIGTLTPGAWTLVDATANLRSNALLTGFEVFGYSGGSNGSSLLDNLSIVSGSQPPPPPPLAPTPEPSSIVLLATGAGALALTLRGRAAWMLGGMS